MRSQRLSLLMVGWIGVIGAVSAHSQAAPLRQQSSTSQRQAARPTSPHATSRRALIDGYCVSCHNGKLKSGGLALDAMDTADVGRGADTWEKVARKLRAGMMPPPGQRRPDAAALNAFVTSLETELDRAAAANPNPGRTETLHRLNRAEYRNAVRDLLMLDVDVTELLPADDASYGFDNIAGVLKLNQSLLERYLSAAMKVSRTAVGSAPSGPLSEVFHVPIDFPQYDHVEGLPFGTRGGTLVRHNVRRNGEYEIKVDLMCTTEVDLKCNGSLGWAQSHELQILMDNELVKAFTLKPREINLASPNQPTSEGAVDDNERWTARVSIPAGVHDIGATFVKGPDVEYVLPGYRKRFERPYRYYADAMLIAVPFVNSLQITGPFGADAGAGETPSRRAIFTCRPATAAEDAPCAKRILARVARRAYRRSVTAAEVDELLAFYRQGRGEQGGTFESGIELAIRRVLTSAKFLFRVEREPETSVSSNYRLNDFELASRLSFFLWSSIPDETLLDLAAKGRLKDPAEMERQVQRMLADNRSGALVENFFGQWLRLRHIERLQPSEPLFPDFDLALKEAFRRETELFLEDIIQHDRGVLDMLTADYTFVNERLAKHYGISYVKGGEFRRVTYPNENRRGLLGHGSILTLTSHAIRTSPVFRGKWVLENILATPPPVPPANVPPLEAPEIGSKKVLTMREQMAKHRANPVCANCHATIDPLGFGLENFDPIGRWRDVDLGFQPIDTSGVLPDGTKFGNLSEFRRVLSSRSDRFVINLVERLLTYSLGRGIEYYDQPVIRQITREAARKNYRLSSIVSGIVASLPFQMRKTESSMQLVASRP